MIGILKVFARKLGINKLFGFLGIDIGNVFYSLIGMPFIIKTYFAYKRQQDKNFKKTKIWLIPGDIKKPAGDIPKHYFQQDLLVARLIKKAKPKEHIDIASRLDGFIANVLTFMPVKMVDVRPLNHNIEGLSFIEGTAEKLTSIKTNSVESLSCLHAIEHFGLGRYGDPVDLQAIYKAKAEFKRVLKKGGALYVSSVFSSENTIFFNAHRVFNVEFFVNELFKDFELTEHYLIDDNENIIKNADFEIFNQQQFGCGIFVLKIK